MFLALGALMSDLRNLELVDFVLKLVAFLKELSVWWSRRAFCRKVREDFGWAKGR